MRIRGAKALILDPELNALVLRRSNTHPHVPFSQDLPGGQIEDGETMVDGLLREIREEIGLDLRMQDVRKCAEATIDNHYGKDYYLELYCVQLVERPHIVMDFEHDKAEWIPLREIKLTEKDRYTELINRYIQQNDA